MIQIAIFRVVVIFGMFIVLGCSKPSPHPNVKSDPALYGVWRMLDERIINAGIELCWTFSENEIVVSAGDEETISRSHYHVDTSHALHHITMLIRDSTEEDRLGIYKIEDGLLHISFNVTEGSRPTAFTDHQPMIFERITGSDL